MSRFVNPVPQFYLNNGDIASAGKLFFYETGTAGASTKKDTYSDFSQKIKNTNPVILSGEGRCPNIFGEGRYTVVFKDSNDIEQWTRDDVELSVEIGQYADWSPILTYRINDIVRGSDGEYYRSITSTNTGNDPTTSSANWEEIAFISFWNANATYSEDDIVILNGLQYRSVTNNNTGNNPESSSTLVWADASSPRPWLSSRTYNEDDVVISAGALYSSGSNSNTGNNPSGGSPWVLLSLTEQTESVELGGDFNAGESVTVSRVGGYVYIASSGSLGHASNSNPASLPGAIPSVYRPSSITASNVYGNEGTRIMKAVSINDGTLRMVYRDYSGTNVAFTDTGDSIFVSYRV